MKRNLKQVLTLWGCMGLSLGINVLPLAQPASAEVLARMQGRCKYMNDTVRVFDGHCTVKHKQQGRNEIVAIELDNGSKYNFFGPNLDSLQVQSYDGMHNVRFTGELESGAFTWQEGGNRNRLSVRVDSQYPADVSFDNPQPIQTRKPTSAEKVGAAVGIGAIILAGILGSKNPPKTPTPPTQATARVGDPVPNLADLVGARGGQAEKTLIERGYQFRGSNQQVDSSFTYWIETRTGNCVAIRTTDGRYGAIVYTADSDCNRR